MPCPSKPTCCCELPLDDAHAKKRPLVDPNCALKVAGATHVGCAGTANIYMFRLIMKNCTEETMFLNRAELNLGCGTVVVKTDAECVSDVLTLQKAIAECPENVRFCLDAGNVKVNPRFEGFPSPGNPDGARLTLPCQRVALPPGETCFQASVILNLGELYLFKPIFTVSACGPHCSKIVAAAELEADCLPDNAEAKTPAPAACVPCP